MARPPIRRSDRARSWPLVASDPLTTVSVVMPVHDEAPTLPWLVDELAVALTGEAFELVAVDDGSADGSGEVLERLAATRPWLVVVRLHRNCGQTAAMAEGIRHAGGDVVVTIDGDGQNDPADIPGLLARLRRGDADVVTGRRHQRKEGLARRATSSAANALCRRASGVDVHDTGCSLKAFRAEVLAGLRLLPDDHRFLPALVAPSRARVAEVWVGDRPRQAGSSHYGFERVPKVAVDLVGIWVATRFGRRPLRAAAWCAAVGVTVWAVLGAVLAVEGRGDLALVAAGMGTTSGLVLVVAGGLVETFLRWGGLMPPVEHPAGLAGAIDQAS